MKRPLLMLSTTLAFVSLVGCGNLGTVTTSGTQQVQLGISSDLQSEVETMFTELKGYAPSSAQLSEYVTDLQNGASTASVAAAIAALGSSSSSSSSSSISSDTANSEITSLFQSTLSRAPSSTELSIYSTMLQNGASLSSIKTIISL